MENNIRETITDIMSVTLQEVISRAMKIAAEKALKKTMRQLVGEIMDENLIACYCDEIMMEIYQATDNAMRQVFYENEEDNDNG